MTHDERGYGDGGDHHYVEGAVDPTGEKPDPTERSVAQRG